MANTNSVSSYSYLSTAGNRFSGLASGMDIDSIVEKLMKAESAKMEKLQQQKQKYEWQRDAYRSNNTKLEAFRNQAFDDYGKVSSFVVNKVSNSNEGKVSAVATSSASGTLNISEAKMATSASNIATGANRTNTTELAKLPGFTSSGTVTLEVLQQDGKYKEVKIDYTSDDTLESFAKKINDKKGGVTAVVGKNGEFSLTAAATGAGDAITIKTDSSRNEGDNTGGVFAAIGFGNDTVLADNGTDAQYTVNGVTQSSASNTFSISGYNITLKSNIAAGDSPTIISSTLDTDTVVDKVKSFIEIYNGLVKDLKGQTSQKKNYNYAPLTDAQKSEMSEDQIKKWEEVAKQGILRNDSSITNALSKMRTAISDTTIELDNGKKMNIFSLGLDTEKDGTIVIKDEAKLRAQIEADPNNVAELFTKSSSTDTSNDGGIVASLRSAAKSAIDSISAKAGKESAGEKTYTIGKEISSISDRIKEWQTRLKTIEERYFSQFSAMETAIQKANSQSSLFA